jgi:transcriptional regulator with XRE-family HTH domain
MAQGAFMPRTSSHPLSRYSLEAALLLGGLIRRGRIERKLTTADLANRLGASRGLVQRIERGDPGCAVGMVFEAAAIVGLRLFDADQPAISAAITANTATLALLPKSVRTPKVEAKDDF